MSGAANTTNSEGTRTGADTLKDYGLNDGGWVAYWKDELTRRNKALDKFRKRGQKTIARYLDEREGTETSVRKFNVLWSNVNTLLPAVFDERPKPVASRRYLDNDPIARVASLMLERTLGYMVDASNELSAAVRTALMCRLLPGVGTIWIRYDDGGAVNVPDPIQQSPITNKATSQRIDERVAIDYVQWSDFVWGPSRTWDEVPYVMRRVYMTRSALKRRFGDKKGELPPLKHRAIDDTSTPAAESKNNDPEINPSAQGVFGTGEVWEIWDKRTRTVTWMCPDIAETLDVKDDPLRFPDFWPCPRPLFATCAHEKLIPVPDYYFYQDQAQELDIVCQRIAMLTRAVKVVGVYDRGQEAIKSLLREGFDNDLIPVDTWAAFAEKGGIKGCVDFLPIDQVIEALSNLFIVKNSIKQDIYEITGLADIIRGASIANETATAQRIKSQFANIRLTDLQNDVARFLTETFRMMAHIVQSYFTDETIKQYSAIDQTPDGQAAMQAAQMQAAQRMMQSAAPPPGGPMQPPPGAATSPGAAGPPPPGPGGNVIPMPNAATATPPSVPTTDDIIAQAIDLLRNSRVAEFRLCVDDASAYEPDVVQERQMRTEYLTALTQFLQQAVPAGQQTPQLVPMFVSIMMWTLRSFRVGKDIEGQLEQALSTLTQSAQQGGEQKPDPEMVKAEGKVKEIEAKVGAMQQKMQLDAQAHQQEMAQDREKHQLEMQQLMEKTRLAIYAMMQKAQATQQVEEVRMQGAMQREQFANATGPGVEQPMEPSNPLDGGGNVPA